MNFGVNKTRFDNFSSYYVIGHRDKKSREIYFSQVYSILFEAIQRCYIIFISDWLALNKMK